MEVCKMAEKSKKEFENKSQIFVLKTNKNVLEIKSNLKPAPQNLASNIHDKYSRIIINLVSFAEGQETVTLTHYVNPETMKAICLDIINGTFEKEYPSSGFNGGYEEYKGTAKSDREDGAPEARKLQIRYSDTYKGQKAMYPYAITLARGKGEVIGEGAVKFAGKPDHTATFMMSKIDAKRLAVQTLDYIRHWEQLQMERIQEDEEIMTGVVVRGGEIAGVVYDTLDNLKNKINNTFRKKYAAGDKAKIFDKQGKLVWTYGDN